MNNPSAISLSPSLLARNNEKVDLVAGKTNKEIHNVIFNENGMVKCNCRVTNSQRFLAIVQLFLKKKIFCKTMQQKLRDADKELQ